MKNEEHRCYFCQEDNGPIQRLFFCKEVQDTSSHTQLTEVIMNPCDYIQEVLISDNKEVQQTFINRVKFLSGQHDIFYELDIYFKSHRLRECRLMTTVCYYDIWGHHYSNRKS